MQSAATLGLWPTDSRLLRIRGSAIDSWGALRNLQSQGRGKAVPFAALAPGDGQGWRLELGGNRITQPLLLRLRLRLRLRQGWAVWASVNGSSPVQSHVSHF